MSFNVGSIYVAVKGNTAPLLKSLRSAKAAAAKAADDIAEEFKKIKMDPEKLNSFKLGVVAVGAAALAAGIKISQIGMEFETTMKTVQAVSRGSEEDFNRLSAAAREMGATTEWSATQSAEALKFLAMAGVSTGDSIKALPGLLDLATAGSMDLATAADIATDTTGAFQLGIEGLARVSDAYAYTASSTNTDIAMMGEAFKESGAMATGFGYEIEEVSAFVGILANNMVKGGSAGTHIKNAILNNSKAAKALGLELDTKLIPTLEALNTSDMTDFEKQTFIFEKYGRIAGNSVAIMMANIDAIKAQEAATRGAVGATQAQAAVMRDTTENMWKIFGSSLEEVSLQMYDTFSGDLKDSLQIATNFVQDNADVFVDWGGKIASVAKVAFGALIIGAGLVSDAFNGWSMTWDVLKISFNAVMRGLTGGLTSFAKKMQKVVSVFSEKQAAQIGKSIESLEKAWEGFDDSLDESENHMITLGKTGSKSFNALESVFGDASKKIVKVSQWENDQINKAVKERAKKETVIIKKRQSDELDVSKKIVKSKKDAAKKILTLEAAARKELGKEADDYYKHELKLINKSEKDYIKSGADKSLSDKLYKKKRKKLLTDLMNDAAESVKKELADFKTSREGMKTSTTQFYTFAKTEIEKQARAIATATSDEKIAAEFKNTALSLLDTARTTSVSSMLTAQGLLTDTHYTNEALKATAQVTDEGIAATSRLGIISTMFTDSGVLSDTFYTGEGLKSGAFLTDEGVSATDRTTATGTMFTNMSLLSDTFYAAENGKSAQLVTDEGTAATSRATITGTMFTDMGLLSDTFYTAEGLKAGQLTTNEGAAATVRTTAAGTMFADIGILSDTFYSSQSGKSGQFVTDEGTAATDRASAIGAMFTGMDIVSDGFYAGESLKSDQLLTDEGMAATDRTTATDTMFADMGILSDGYFESEDAKTKEQAAAEVKAAQDRDSAIESMYTSNGTNADAYYDLEERRLLKQKNDHGTALGDMNAADDWYEKEHSALLAKKSLSTEGFFATVETGIDGMETSYGGFFNGFSDGIKEHMEKPMTTWAETGTTLATQFADGASGALSSNLFDILHGDFDSLGDAWSSLWDSMLKTVVDKAAAMAVEWALKGAMQLGTAAIDFLTLEDGDWDIGKQYPDSMGRPGHPTVTHDGEMVIPAKQSDQLRSAFGSVGVTDFTSLSTFLETFGQSMGYKMAAGAGMLTGTETSVGDVFGAVFNPKSILMSAVGAGITTVNELQGFRSSKWGTWGQNIASQVGGMFGGIPGSVGGAAIGGAIGMGIGDVFNQRNYEPFRDMLEDIQGWRGGVKTFRDPALAAALFGTTTEVMSGSNRDYRTGRGDDYSSYERESKPGGMGGFAKGGEVNKLYIPKGDDGIAGLKFGETVLTQQGTKNLNKIEDGSFGSGGDRLSYEELKTMKRLLRLAQKWDADGLPPARVA